MSSPDQTHGLTLGANGVQLNFTMATHVKIHNEHPDPAQQGKNWQLYFQQVTYHYDNGNPDEDGYRFIWRRPDRSLQAARGQARLPNATTIDSLIAEAKSQGWLT
jgi:hypothetical protein